MILVSLYAPHVYQLLFCPLINSAHLFCNTFKRMPSFFTSNYFSNWSQILKILIYTKFIFFFSQILYIKIQEVTSNMYFYCFFYSMSAYIYTLYTFPICFNGLFQICELMICLDFARSNMCS
jgi:hypothetical protein